MSQAKYVRWFNEIGINDVPLVGGKNASLGEMYRELSPLGVNVPNGFATTAAAYYDNISELSDTLSSLLAKIDPSDLNTLSRYAAEIRKAVYDHKLSDSLQSEIIDAYHQLKNQYVDDNSWSLSSRHIKLDRAKGVGTAYHATLRVKNVPVFYTPYISFPLSDKRKSGFLAPSFGSFGVSGTEILTPYYWNIAPNYDATITPRYLEKRGLQLQNEFRYLKPRHHGIVEAEYLASDNLFNDDRSFLRLQHDSAFSNQWRGSLLFAEVSDANYFEDLGDSLSITAITHLERRADLTYNGNWGNLLARVQDYQTINDAIPASGRPYKRLPQLLYSSSLPSYLDIDSQVRGEWVQFDRTDSVTASRFDVQPTLSDYYGRSWGFFQPKLSLRHTQYDLDNQAAGIGNSRTRTLPISSLDGGLFFDKPLSWGKRAFIHTLEPRLFYLYVPFDNQDDIPTFDTGINDFTFDQMFRDNRF
ncbi:LPS assembly protein LptD, partial [Beggiatoa alba]|nr:LPS assembly protein LptD [Beggiatoa alba]